MSAALAAIRVRFLSYAGGGVAKDRQAIIVLGFPGSGRTDAIKRIAKRVGAAFIDIEYVKSLIPEYENGYGTAAVHNEASWMGAVVASDICIDGTNVIVKRVGNQVSTILGLMSEFKSIGYSTTLVLVRMNVDEACRNAAQQLLTKGLLFEQSAFKSGDPYEAVIELLKKDPEVAHVTIQADAGLDRLPACGSTRSRLVRKIMEALQAPETDGSLSVPMPPVLRGISPGSEFGSSELPLTLRVASAASEDTADQLFQMVVERAREFLRIGEARDLFVKQTLPGLVFKELEAAMLGYKLIVTAARASVGACDGEVDRILRHKMVAVFLSYSRQLSASLAQRVSKPGERAPDTSDYPENVAATLMHAQAVLDDADAQIVGALERLRDGASAPFSVYYPNLRIICGGASPPQEEERLFGPMLRELYAPIGASLNALYAARRSVVQTDGAKVLGSTGVIANRHIVKLLGNARRAGILGAFRSKVPLLDRIISIDNSVIRICANDGASAGRLSATIALSIVGAPRVFLETRAAKLGPVFRSVEKDVLAFEVLAFSAYAVRQYVLALSAQGESAQARRYHGEHGPEALNEAFQEAWSICATTIDSLTGWDASEVFAGRLMSYGAASSIAGRLDATSGVAHFQSVLMSIGNAREPLMGYERSGQYDLAVFAESETFAGLRLKERAGDLVRLIEDGFFAKT
jgi:hypothetical protein